jgi:hypothetical protein
MARRLARLFQGERVIAARRQKVNCQQSFAPPQAGLASTVDVIGTFLYNLFFL